MNMTIQKTINAWQWDKPDMELPEGVVLCQPEVHYSAGREYVYFTYADLRSECWISTNELRAKPEVPFTGQVMRTEMKDGREYFREVLPFACWSIKSEASVRRDHRPEFLDAQKPAQFQAFLDYACLAQWFSGTDRNVPPRVEFREINGSYGRGYRPYYLKRGDWLVKDGKDVRVASNDEFTRMKAEAA